MCAICNAAGTGGNPPRWGDPRIQLKDRHGLRTFAQTGAVRGGEQRRGGGGEDSLTDSCTRGGRREDGDGAAKPRRQRHRRQGPLRVCAVYVHGRWVSRCWRRCGDAPSEGRWGVLRTGVLSRRFNAARGRVRACGLGWSLCHSWGAQAGVDAGKGNRATYRGNRSAPGTMHRACGAHGRLRVQWCAARDVTSLDATRRPTCRCDPRKSRDPSCSIWPPAADLIEEAAHRGRIGRAVTVLVGRDDKWGGGERPAGGGRRFGCCEGGDDQRPRRVWASASEEGGWAMCWAGGQ